MLRPLLSTFALCLFLGPSASAQTWTEDFENGSNAAGWEAWFSPYNSVESSGGNPGGYLRLDNTSGPSNCHYVELFPDTALLPQPYGGNWRSKGVNGLGLDVNVVLGPAPAATTQWIVTLVSDPDTPADPNDDCRLVLYDATTPVPVPGGGWQSYDWTLDTGSPTLPPGWTIEGPCISGNWDAVWNMAITDIDWFEVTFDTDSSAFCLFNQWDMGYDNLRVTESDGIGSNYCTPNSVNSTGSPAEIKAFGSPLVTDQSLSLQASSLPANQFCYFITSETQGLVMNPGGSQGNLCILGTIGRFNAQVGSSGPNGVFSISVDMANIPTSPADVITAGDTWNFQAWYRDLNPAPTSNFTDAISVVFF